MARRINTLCNVCAFVCAVPAFSEGPKIQDERGNVVRMQACRYYCPRCMSDDLSPAPDDLPLSTPLTEKGNDHESTSNTGTDRRDD